MFALAHQPFQHAFHYPASSPLSPLNPNAGRVKVEPSMAHKGTSIPALKRKPGFFSSSRVQHTPALTRRDPQKIREKRRFEFLSKVKQEREERNFEARNDRVIIRSCCAWMKLLLTLHAASTIRCYRRAKGMGATTRARGGTMELGP